MPYNKTKEKEECVGQHFYDLLERSTWTDGDFRSTSGIVICRKCGKTKVVTIKNEIEAKDTL
jgi:hypothetical protein